MISLVYSYIELRNIPEQEYSLKKELNYNFFEINGTAAEGPTLKSSFSPNLASHWNFTQEPPKSLETAGQNILTSAPNSSINPAELNELKAEILEIQKTAKLKSDRYNHSLQRLENQQSQMSADISEKFALLIQKLTEQKKYDQKVQDIVDRHNNLLKGYEVRLNQMQKLLGQKEQDYVEAITTLKDLKAEITRLKRL